jgi:protein-tyrosine-phosphatase
MAHIKNILIVCTGNACRSPMAEGFLKHYLDLGTGCSIVSAGISAVDGTEPTPAAVQVMREAGIDISGFRSSAFSDLLAESADLILVMARKHKDFIVDHMPGISSKVFLYKEYADIAEPYCDIPDPIAQPIEVYRSVCNMIKAASENIAQKIKNQ